MKKLMDLFMDYFTARVDIKNYGNQDNNVLIYDNCNNDIDHGYPLWFKDNQGNGLVINDFSGALDFKLICINDGNLKIRLRGPDIKDDSNKRIPIHITYTTFEINQEKVMHENTIVWHDKPYYYERNVEDSEIIHVHIEWIPFKSSKFNESPFFKRFSYFEKQISSIPRLTSTSIGKSTLDGKVSYRNWGGFSVRSSLMDEIAGYCENEWFTLYLEDKFPNENFKINFFGPFNKHYTIKSEMEGKKVFWSPENLNLMLPEMREEFDRYALDYVDLSMGYDFVDNSKYLRFPIWYSWLFPPTVNEEFIEETIDFWNILNYDKTRDVVNVSRHDNWGTRTFIANDIENLVNITYAGKWRNNSNELWDKYNDSRKELYKEFKFDLCAENRMDDAYVTEKIFEAIRGDCIPLYAGGGNYLEPDILNHKTILRWYEDENSDNSDTIELFKNLLNDEKSYNEFKEEPPLLESSKKHIINKFSDLEKQFERLIYD